MLMDTNGHTILSEDYCSYEIAKMLKEKGFNERSIASYDSKGQLQEGYGYWNKTPIWCAAPTYQMAMKWLREHKIYIMIDRSWSMEDSWQYCICVNNDFDHLIQQDSIPNRTYEEAVETALKYVLKNLI